jgi:two-component system alkaline phosphatase synthesis response regulator PhoP
MQNIVIIDDSRDIHAIVRSEFTEEPWNIHSAYTGGQGLAMASLCAADLILLDVDLPDLNGFDVCRHLKADTAMARTSVIFLTASATSDERICGLQLGVADYLTKPFDLAELHLRVRSALRIKGILDVVPECVIDFHAPDYTANVMNHALAGPVSVR